MNIKSSKTLVLLAVVVLLMAAFVGCSSNEEPVEAEARVIVDQLGREVILPDEINRVATTFRPVTFFTFAIGGQEKLVAVDNNSTKSKFLTGVYPEIANVPAIGDKKNGYNLEAIVASNPDVVILHSGKGMDEIYQQLSDQGIVCITVVPESLEDMKKTAKILGVVFDQEEQSEEVIAYYDSVLEMIDDRVGDIPKEERKTVYMTGGDTLKTVSKDLYQHYLIESARGVSVSEEMTGYFPQVSAEQIVEWNPDAMFSIFHNFDGTVESIVTNPQFSSIDAVKNKEVYKFPSKLGAWDYPEPRSALGLLWLAAKLYPAEFEDINLIEEVNNFHIKFYGKSYEELGGTEAELIGK